MLLRRKYVNTTIEVDFEFEEIKQIDNVQNINAATEVKIICKIIRVTLINFFRRCINFSKRTLNYAW